MPPASSGVPFLFTVHDTTHLDYGNAFHRAYFNHVIRRLAKPAASVLTVSEYSRSQILTWSGLAPQQVVAIPLGIGAVFCEQGPAHQMGKSYILYVGNRRSNKNVPRMIQAFAKANIDPQMVMALSGGYDAELHAVAASAGIADRLVFLGLIPEEDLPAVYRGATALMYVSLSEGFGLPPLEALACGTPVLVSNVTSLPEVVGDAGLLVDPTDVPAIAHALGTIVNDAALRARLKQSGLERAKNFSWDRCAAQTWHQILSPTF